MKLLQYRFSPSDLEMSVAIGKSISSFFERVKDIDLNIIYVSHENKETLSSKSINIGNLSIIISDAFSESFSNSREYGKGSSVRSIISCRFIVVEDDGLVRMCYSNDDEVVDFGPLYPEVTDISSMLIETDLFDFSW